MYIKQLHNPEADVLIINNVGNMVVLAASGAVFRDFFTDELTHIEVASSNLFEADWRLATEVEMGAWLVRTDTPILAVSGYTPTPSKPSLRRIK
jgi:hypothetical protein